MSIEHVDTVVVGAGVVGLACARALARAGQDVVVLEAGPAIGMETSSRNSEVIHAGIYYPTGSLKARLCVDGRRALYDYCCSHGVPHRRCGKLIVAVTDEQVERLDRIREQALANDVDDLVLVTRDEALALEPALECTAALHSPSTGIVDSHAFMLALQGDLEDAGAMIAFATPVSSGQLEHDQVVIETGGDAPMTLCARRLVNSAGLGAPDLAASLRGLDRHHVPAMHFAKGNYYALRGRSPFQTLIYPVPEKAGLGVHLTIDMAGTARFGPDVEWVERLDYDVDPRRADSFYAAVRTYWPGLPDDSLDPAYAGIRPKLQAPGEPPHDFVLQGPADHGHPGLVNLLGIESPGLTASLAIADEVVAMLDA